jgi:hypothetical protein
VLNPAGLGEYLSEFFLGYRADFTFRVENYGSGAAGALIEGDDVFRHIVQILSLIR